MRDGVRLLLQQAALFLPLTLYGCHSVSDRLGNQLIVGLTHEPQHHLTDTQRDRQVSLAADVIR